MAIARRLLKIFFGLAAFVAIGFVALAVLVAGLVWYYPVGKQNAIEAGPSVNALDGKLQVIVSAVGVSLHTDNNQYLLAKRLDTDARLQAPIGTSATLDAIWRVEEYDDGSVVLRGKKDAWKLTIDPLQLKPLPRGNCRPHIGEFDNIYHVCAPSVPKDTNAFAELPLGAPKTLGQFEFVGPRKGRTFVFTPSPP
jgi:hypothetical protein